MHTDRARRAAGLLLLAAALPGCGLLKTTAEMPGRVASAALKPGAKPAPDPESMQARLRRFADVFASEITRATGELAERNGTPEGRVQALTWRIDYTNSLWRIASGQRPFAALFDVIAVVTFLRDVHEKRWIETWGEADRPLLEALVRMEEGVWILAAEGLSETHVAEVRQIVDTWLAGDPASRLAEVTKLPGFVDLTSGAKGGTGLMSELTGLMRVDPLSGLEPAVREVAQTRELLESALYYLQRQPEILSARVELLVLRASLSPETVGTLASVERVSQAAASLADTAAALPASFAAEREAALAQISAELTAQREGLVADLETARAPVTELLTSTRDTAEAGAAMATSLTETLHALDAFVGRFDDGDEETSEAPAHAGEAPKASDTPAEASAEPAGRPFDINDYGAAAERIGIAARELGTTIATLERSLPEVQRVLDEAVTRTERTVDHAFWRALQLLGVALAGTVVAVLVVRRIPPRVRG